MIFDGLAKLIGASADTDRAPESDFWFTPLGYSSAAGRITPETAMRASAVFTCVKIIAETLGSLPLITYRRLPRGKERATDNPIYKLLRYRPNRWQNSMQFIEMLTAHAAMRGTGFAEKVYSPRGELLELIPWHPDNVRCDRLENGNLGVLYTDPRSGRSYAYREEDVFFLSGFSLDGRLGLSVIGHAAQAIGMALAAEDYGARFFQNDARPGGVLTHPSHFRDKAARDNFRKQWREAQSGANRHKTAVLEDGMKYEDVGLTNVDAQFLESRKFQLADIARLFRVPLVLLGETEKSTSWGTGIEQFMIAFVTHTVRPWCVRWEQALQRDFFDDEAVEDEFFAEFLVDALTRGDIKSRYEAYNIAIDKQWMLPNEAREKENMNPLPGGDQPYIAPNATKPSAPPSSQPKEEPDDEEAAARQVVRKEVAALRRAYASHEGFAVEKFQAWVKRFYGVHEAYVVGKLGVSPEFARRHCNDQAAEVMQTVEAECGTPQGTLPVAVLPALLDAWEAHKADELVASVRNSR